MRLIEVAIRTATPRAAIDQWQAVMQQWPKISAGSVLASKIDQLFAQEQALVPLAQQLEESDLAIAYATYRIHPVRIIAREHKQKILDLMRQLAVAAGATDPELLARQLLLLIDGAITVAMVMGSPSAADDARETAKMLISTQTTP